MPRCLVEVHRHFGVTYCPRLQSRREASRSNLPTVDNCVGLQVLTEMAMNNTVFWGVTPCSLIEVYRRFRGTYCLHLQGQGVISVWFIDLPFYCKVRGNMFFRNTGKHLQDSMTSQPLHWQPKIQHMLADVLRVFPQSFLSNVGIMPETRLHPLPSTPF